MQQWNRQGKHIMQSPAVRFVPLKWFVLRLSWQPPKGASAYVHYWSLQEAASVKVRNPERRVLNMYHALVVILRDFTPPTRRKVAFEGCFVWGRQVRLTVLFPFVPAGLLDDRVSLWFACCPLLLPSSSCCPCLSPVKSFPKVVSGIPFFSVHLWYHGRVDPTTCCK